MLEHLHADRRAQRDFESSSRSYSSNCRKILLLTAIGSLYEHDMLTPVRQRAVYLVMDEMVL